MAKQSFSTGVPRFDQFVGGISPGDSFLTFVTQSAHSSLFPSRCVGASTGVGKPIVFSAASRPPSTDWMKLGGHIFDAGSKELRPDALLLSIRRYASGNAKGTTILVDELSSWKGMLGSEKRIVELVKILAEVAIKNESLLIISALRSEFDHATLAALKDLCSIVFEIHEHQNKLFCLPLSLRGRYVPQSVFPFQLDIEGKEGLVKDPSVSEVRSKPGLERAPTKREEDALESHSHRYEASFLNAPEASLLFRTDGTYIEGNERAAHVLGVSLVELTTTNLFALVDAAQRWFAMKFYLTLKGKKSQSITLDVHPIRGKKIRVDVSVKEIGGGLFLAVLRDVSHQHRHELAVQHRLEEYGGMFDSLPVGVAQVHAKKIVHCNRGFALMVGCSSVEACNSKLVKDCFSPESGKKIVSAAEKLGETSVSFTDGIFVRRSDGSLSECHVTLAPAQFDGTRAVQMTVVDVSASVAALNILKASEDQFRMMVERSPAAVAVVRSEHFVMANGAFLALLGYESLAGIVGREMIMVMKESDRERLAESLKKRSSSKQAQYMFRGKGQRGDGTTFDLEMTLLPELRKGDFLLHCRDVSNEMELHRAMQLQMKQMEAVSELMETLGGMLDTDKLLPHLLRETMNILTWDAGMLFVIRDRPKDLKLVSSRHISDDVASKLESLPIEEGLGGYLSKTQEALVYTLDDYPSFLPFKQLWASSGWKSVGLLPLVAREQFIGMMLFGSKKVVDQRVSSSLLRAIISAGGMAVANARLYDEVKESEERHRGLTEAYDGVFYVATPAGAIEFVSPAIESLIGYPPREFYRNPTLWLKLVHPDDKKILLERTANMSAIVGRHVSEYRMLPKGKATYRKVRDEMTVELNAEGSAENILGNIHDVTESEHTLVDLQRARQLSTGILGGIQIGIVAFDARLIVTEWNGTMTTLTSIPADSALGRKAEELFPQFENQSIRQVLLHVLEGEDAAIRDIQFNVPGSKRQGHLAGRFAPMRDDDGDVAGVVGVMEDITDKRHHDDELHESGQILQNVIDTMSDILLIADLRGMVMEVNKSFLRALGYSRAETIGLEFPYPWLLEEEMGRFVLWIANLREKNWLHDFDMTWRAKDGRQIPMSLSTTLLRNAMGEPIATLNIARDITDRTRLTRDLESRNKQMEIINRIIGKANQTMDFDEVFAAISEEIRTLLPADDITVALISEDGTGFSTFALSGGSRTLERGTTIPLDETVSRIALETERPVVIPDLAADAKYETVYVRRKGIRSVLSFPIMLKGKVFGTLNIGSKKPDQYTDELAVLLAPVVQQVGTVFDRVRLFRQVSDDALYIHNLLDSIKSIVYTVDTQLRIREVNKAWNDYLQESGVFGTRVYQGLNLYDVLPDESLKEAYRDVISDLMNGRMRVYSQEFTSQKSGGAKVYHLTVTPMVIDQKITGLVFTQTDITALKRSEAELKKNNEQLLALSEISSLINTSLDLEEILGTSIPLLRRDIAASAALVYLIGQNDSDLVLAKQVGFDHVEFEPILRLQQESSATGTVIRTKEPLYVTEHAAMDERILPANREVLRQARCEAMAVIPLVSKDKVLGALDIFYDHPYQFTGQERQMLSLVGNQLGTAIENAQLYGELRSQIDRLTVLYDLSQQLTSTLEIDHIFGAVHRSIQQVVPFEIFSIGHYDSATRTIIPEYVVAQRAGESPVISEKGEPIVLTNDSPEWQVVESKRSVESDDRTAMFVPMLSKERIIGIMMMRSAVDATYSVTHLRLLESIANLAAIALEKAKLYEETVRISLEIQRRNKELDDFTYVVSHDLKEPLISIEGFSRILQADYQDAIQAEGKEYLDSIVGATTRMKGLIDDLLMLSRVSRPSESVKTVSLQEIIDDIKTDMEFTIKQKGVQFVVPSNLPTIVGNETQLQIVFRNLIGNAVKFNNKPEPRVEIGFQNAENNSYLFYIKDNGIGIDRDFHEKIFVIFQRLHRREEYEGSGAGLAIVKKILESHKGRIWVESELGMGTTFNFTIPKGYIHEG